MTAMNNILLYLKNMRLIKKILLGLFIFLSAVILFISVTVATQKGSRWVIDAVAGMVGLQVTDIHGNLLTGLDVDALDYKQGELMVHLEKVSFRWQPLALFYTTVSVQSLSAEKIVIHLPPAKNEPEPEIYTWPSFAQPVRIELGKIKLRNIRIEQGENIYPINSIDGSLASGAFRLQAKDLVVVNPQAKITVNGAVGLRYPYKFSVKSQWQFNTQDTQIFTLSGDANLDGDIKLIQVEHRLIQPVAIQTVGKIALALHEKQQKPDLEITNTWSDQALPAELLKRIDPDGKVYFLNTLLSSQGNLQAKGWLDQYQLQGNVIAKMVDADVLIDINGNGNYLANDVSRNTPAVAKLHVEKLQVTAKESSHVTPADNQSAIKKPLENNYLLLTGDFDFLPALKWNINVSGEHVNVGQFVAQWPSDLHINLMSQGEVLNRIVDDKEAGEKWRLDVSNININGTLREYKVSTAGEIHFDGAHWTSSNLDAAVGDNKLLLKGQAGNELALEWTLNAPALNQIDPQLHGSITSTGVVSGDIAQPQLQVNAQANQFGWRDYTVENLTLKLNPRSGKLQANGNYDLALDAKNLQLSTQYISHVVLAGDGNIGQHNISGQIDSVDYGTLKFGLASGWKDNRWQGKLSAFNINYKKIPPWYLSSSTQMEADKSHADFGRLCLTTANELSLEMETASAQKRALQETPVICAEGKWNAAADTTAKLTAQAVPLSSLRAWFKPEVTLAGVIDGDVNVRAKNAMPVVMDANLQTRDAKLFYQFQGGNVEEYPLQKGSANLVVKNNIATAAATMDWAKYGSLSGDAKYTLGDKKIQVKATADLPNLAPLEGLLPMLNNVRGSASGSVNVNGTLDDPQVTGSFNLANGSANLPKLGLELKNINYQVTSPSINSAHVEGKITSGDGTLVTQGDFINVGAADWHWQANVFGADIRIIQQTQLTANISPNLRLSANAKSIELTGSTEIPWARANVKNLPESATRVSSDVVIIEKNNLSAESLAKKSIPFHTNIILYFGDDVLFKGFGLDTRLTGKVNVLKEENRQMFTTGFVAVEKGVYKAYGQELNIERGRLVFQGPYDNPGLDIRALRVADEVTAGLDIAGTLQRPKSTVFAIPAKPDSDAMAILLTGKPLSQSSKEDAYTIIGAIGKLGMNQGDSMSADIAHKVGLDEIAVKADGGLDQSALSVGKYVTPKLFIRYIVGLFDQASAFGMTYKINDKMHLEAESGKIQSVDLMYKIER